MNNGVYIERIDILSFGKLSGVSFAPSKGLNLLTAPNEAGKSTLASFIKFIFYGFAGQRRQSVSENEKLLYLPWDGKPAAGGITLATPDGEFRVERAQSAAKETLDVYDVRTRKSVFTGMVPGEVFFGIGEESFQKILYFQRIYSPKNADAALAEQIQNLIFSADEKVSAQRAVKRLKEARAELKNAQRRGLIPELEAQLATYDGKLAEALGVKQELDKIISSLNEKKQKIAFNEDKLLALENEAENIKKHEAKLRLDGLVALAKKKKEADEKYEACVSEFGGGGAPETAFVQELINDNALYTVLEKRLDETSAQIKEEIYHLEAEKASAGYFQEDPEARIKEHKRHTALAAAFLSAGLAAGLFAVYQAAVFNLGVLFYVSLGVFAALSAAFALSMRRAFQVVKKAGFQTKAHLWAAAENFPVTKHKIEEKERRVREMEKAYAGDSERYGALRRSISARIRQYMSGEENTYGLMIQKMLNLSMEAGALKAECMAFSGQLEAALAEVDIEKIKLLAEGATAPPRPAAAVSRETEFYKSANEALYHKKLELERQKAALDARAVTPSVLYAKRESVASRLQSYKLKYDALETALDVLNESRDYMKSTISPKLAELASAYFNKATGGKYPEVRLSTDLMMSVDTDLGEKSAEYLSGGAKDAAYLCLRHALVELLYERKRPFIVLDDAFSRIDDGRVKLMQKSLVSLAAFQQIFVLTCHSREGEFLAEMTDGVNVLSI